MGIEVALGTEQDAGDTEDCNKLGVVVAEVRGVVVLESVASNCSTVNKPSLRRSVTVGVDMGTVVR